MRILNIKQRLGYMDKSVWEWEGTHTWDQEGSHSIRLPAYPSIVQREERSLHEIIDEEEERPSRASSEFGQSKLNALYSSVVQCV